MVWNPQQFLDTLAFFDVLPGQKELRKMISIFGFMKETTDAFALPIIQNGLLFDFKHPSPSDRSLWGSVDDVVMGGSSQSGLTWGDDTAWFKGNVSTAGGGGFASVRTRNFDPPLNLSVYGGLKLTVKGDGNRYKFLLRDTSQWDSVAYSFAFNTQPDRWIEVPILFEQMIPVFRARRVEPPPPLDPSRIYALQFMLSKFEYNGALNEHFTPGNFELSLGTLGVLPRSPI